MFSLKDDAIFGLSSHLLNALIQTRNDEGPPTSEYTLHLCSCILPHPPHYLIRANSKQCLSQAPSWVLKLTVSPYADRIRVLPDARINTLQAVADKYQ